MSSAGARALLSAARPRLATLPRVLSTSSSPHGSHSCKTTHGHVHGSRGLHAGSSKLAPRPGDAVNASTPPADEGDKPPNKTEAEDKNKTRFPSGKRKRIDKDKDKDDAAETPASDAPPPTAELLKETPDFKENLKPLGYGSARARASRRSGEELPSLHVPQWFRDEHVFLAGEGHILPREYPLSGESWVKALDDLHELLDFVNDGAAACTKESSSMMESLKNTSDSGFLTKVLLFENVLLRHHVLTKHAADFLELAFTCRKSCSFQTLSAMQVIKLAFKTSTLGLSKQALPPAGEALTGCLGAIVAMHKWLMHVGPNWSAIYQTILSSRPESQHASCTELAAVVAAGFSVQAPRDKQAQDLNRSVTLLSIVDQQGASVANRIFDEIATALDADVVHLDAASLSRIMGSHLGQNAYWGTESVASLGYGTAEMNGRQAGIATGRGSFMEALGLSQPRVLRIGALLHRKDGFAYGPGAPDERWEELKVNRALETLLGQADVKRAETCSSSGKTPERPLLVHIHDYVELSALQDGIIRKLRSTVDRMWHQGRKAFVVASSSSGEQTSTRFRDQLLDMSGNDMSVIPLRCGGSRSQKRLLESVDNMKENTVNLKAMLEAMAGKPVLISEWHKCLRAKPFPGWPEFATTGEDVPQDDADKLSDQSCETLCSQVCQANWLRRVASIVFTNRNPGTKDPIYQVTAGEVSRAIEFIVSQDQRWAEQFPEYSPPLYLPSTAGHGSMTGADMESPMPGTGPNDKRYDAHESKLLSGLINAEDIHTTFDDIVLPPDTKDSIISLTTLSIIRPEAFSYGILKAERIPGCLLYGPPGTGKTLLARAVAKQSGARMLEVSAASINDMWVGNSEKNVRALFSLARKLAPTVIFLDEADALLGSRDLAARTFARRETITQFLREWDGLHDMGSFIMVATNRPFDLDEAVLRRLPRKMLIDLPLRPQREAILRTTLRGEALEPAVDLAALAARTELYSGSDLKNLCVAAAMEAVREEVRARDAHAGPVPFAFPPRRVLTAAHFEKGLADISASISEDMESLKAIRKFDERYGDAGRRRKARRGVGFEVVPPAVAGTEEARVRRHHAVAVPA